MTSRQAAEQVRELYVRLDMIESLLIDITEHGGLQEVCFHRLTSTYSGPHSYRPIYVSHLILAAVKVDLETQKLLLTQQIERLGFSPTIREVY